MRIGKNKKKTREIIYILIGIVFIALFAKEFFLYSLNRIEAIFYPVQSTIYSITKKAQKNKENIINYKDLINENEMLKKSLIEKSLLEESNEKFSEENERLRKILNMKESFKYKFVVGEISFQQTRELYESFTINLGEKDGIKKNMPILSNEILIGKIEKVFEKHSVVQMLTFQDSTVSSLANEKVLGVTKGQRNDELIFEPVSFYEVKLEKGDKIYTSGISNIYPKGLYIGEISEIRKKYGDINQYIVKFPVNVIDIREVIVITTEVN